MNEEEDRPTESDTAAFSWGGAPMPGEPPTPIQELVAAASRAGPVLETIDPDGHRVLYVSTVALATEVCEDARFDKSIRALTEARRFAGDGLFTADTDEPAWGRAHRVLLPAFAPGPVGAFLPEMWDTTQQLLLKWQRLNPGEEIDVLDDLVRFALETVCLCAFDYRLNSFYRERPHPFAEQVAEALAIGQARQFARPLPPDAEARFEAAVQGMYALVDRLIAERRAAGTPAGPPRDVLDVALWAQDPRTGEHLSDENIRYQVVTFLIAGHETTSALLSFTIALLLREEQARSRARDEVDAVLGGDVDAAPTAAQLRQLRQVRQVLMEALRLYPPASVFSRRPRAPTVLGGKWAITPEDDVRVLLPLVHRDPAVWGPDPERFDPSRFDPEAEAARPPAAWMPFGTGQRACLGRNFAMQEATLALAKILQRFDLVDPVGYRLRLRQAGGIKPDGLRLVVRRRVQSAVPRPAEAPAPPRQEAPRLDVPTHATPLLLLFGSNLGTSEGFARRFAEAGRERGWAARAGALDDAVGALPRDGAVVIVCSTYNGTPPDNATRFCAWLDEQRGDAARGVRYAVFGCGHRDWASTFQAVPRRIDERLAALGGQRLVPRGIGDARDDLDGDFRGWEGKLWGALGATFGVEARPRDAVEAPPAVTVHVLPEPVPNPFVRTFGARPFCVRVNRELQRRAGPDPSERSTHHLELELPDGTSWRAGDHVGVIPHNSPALVERALARFGLTLDARLRVTCAPAGPTSFPAEPVGAALLFMQYVELHDRATRPQIRVLAEHTPCPHTRRKLELLAGDDVDSVARYRAWVLEPHRTVLDLLEEAPACRLPLGTFLSMLAPLRPRYYSISSSPLVDARSCSLTVSVVDAPARRGHGTYAGVCSTYLGTRPEGSYIHAFVRSSPAFSAPIDPALPLLLVGAGTGIAPLRGVLLERTVMRARGQPLGPSLLFFGFRRPDHDFLYEDELKLMEAQGVTRVIPACSHVPGAGMVFVQARIEERGDAVWELLERDAVVLVSGDGAYMAPGVRKAFQSVWRHHTGGDAEGAERWLQGLVESGRYREDVFGTAT
ncbi:MAG: cytochrome P450 [Myxococcota bacterium]